jgi:hypothetical protein
VGYAFEGLAAAGLFVGHRPANEGLWRLLVWLGFGYRDEGC